MTAVSTAREMGFDQDTIDDLVAQGLLVDDEAAAPWRPINLTDVNWIVSRYADYDAEEARIKAQYERRMKAINARRQWLSRYAADCQEILEANLPRDASGKPKRLYLDLEDGRVKLQRRGGGVVVDQDALLAFYKARYETPSATLVDFPAVEAVRAVRKEQETGMRAIFKLVNGSDDWKPEILKTPISDFLKKHPEAELPGVCVEPVRYEFTIETKAS